MLFENIQNIFAVYNCSFIAEEAFILKFEDAEINVIFFRYRGDKLVNIVCVY